MRLFSFDKFWELEWEKTSDSNIYKSQKGDFVFEVDRTRSTSVLFSIGLLSGEKGKYLLTRLNTDYFIMQLKSIKETGKIIKN